MNANILVVDDHEIIREGVRTLLKKWRPEWQICGEAADGPAAIQAVSQLRPDAVVLDITMPSMSGIEAARQIVHLELGTRVLIFTMHESDRLVSEVRQAGAHGYVLKSQAGRDLVAAIDTLLSGGTFFGPASAPPKTQPAKGNTGSAPMFRVRRAFGAI